MRKNKEVHSILNVTLFVCIFKRKTDININRNDEQFIRPTAYTERNNLFAKTITLCAPKQPIY